jgi:hypothetical protein
MAIRQGLRRLTGEKADPLPLPARCIRSMDRSFGDRLATASPTGFESTRGSAAGLAAAAASTGSIALGWGTGAGAAADMGLGRLDAGLSAGGTILGASAAGGAWAALGGGAWAAACAAAAAAAGLLVPGQSGLSSGRAPLPFLGGAGRRGSAARGAYDTNEEGVDGAGGDGGGRGMQESITAGDSMSTVKSSRLPAPRL